MVLILKKKIKKIFYSKHLILNAMYFFISGCMVGDVHCCGSTRRSSGSTNRNRILSLLCSKAFTTVSCFFFVRRQKNM